MSKPTMTQAVIELWATLNDLPKLYNEDLPEDAPEIPSAYFLHNGEAAGRDTYNTASTKPSVLLGAFDIVIFSTGIASVETLAAIVKAAFTPSSLSMDTSQETHLWRTNYTVRGTPWLDDGGNQTYMATISYQCYIGNPKD